MKKVIMRIGAISLAVFMLAGCSNTNQKDTDETFAERSKRTIAEKETTIAETTAAITTIMEETEAETTAPPTTVFEASVNQGEDLTRGVWTDNVYTNAYAGITFTLPEGFTANSDEELALLMQIGAEALGEAGSGYSQETLENVASLYDMFAMDLTTGSNILIVFENLSVNSVFGMFADENAYLEIRQSQVEAMEEQGITYTFSDISDHQIGDQTYKMITTKTSMEVAGIEIEMENAYLVKKIDNYIVSITITAAGGGDMNTMISAFQ